MTDLISRQAAIDAIERNAYRHTYIDQIVGIINDLPSAQPEPPAHGSISAKTAQKQGNRTTDDCISRQAAIDETKKIPDLSVYAYCSFLDMLAKLPSVEACPKYIPVTGRQQILVVEVPGLMKEDDIKLLRKRIIDQMKDGLVVLPKGVRAITCDTDMVIFDGYVYK